MIPKKIHYCWFGGKPLPEDAKKCISSWRKIFPDYEIIEWNESNFDFNSIPYTCEAYSVGKYAFVSDYARFKILYENGGLYFDTDVEVIKPFDDIVAAGPFMGFETSCGRTIGWVAPGLGLGAFPGMPFYKEILDYYGDVHFLTDGVQNTKTVGEHTTGLLIKHGLGNVPGIQSVAGFLIYPPEYFNPLDDATGRLRITPKTHSIHWYSKTWLENNSKIRIWTSRMFHRIFGVSFISNVKSLFR